MRTLKRQRGAVAYFGLILIDEIGISSLTGYIGEAMDKPPFSLAFFVVKESFVAPARLFYPASDANKNKHQESGPYHLTTIHHISMVHMYTLTAP